MRIPLDIDDISKKKYQKVITKFNSIQKNLHKLSIIKPTLEGYSMRKLTRCLIVTLFLPSQVFGSEMLEFSIEEDHPNVMGQICEDLAYDAYRKHFSDKSYKILKNISYSQFVHEKKTKKYKYKPAKPHQIYGELDIIVLKDNVLCAVGEVKCPKKKNILKAEAKAMDQLTRFMKRCIEDKCSFWGASGTKQIYFDVPRDKREVAFSIVSYEDSKDDFLKLSYTYSQLVSY